MATEPTPTTPSLPTVSKADSLNRAEVAQWLRNTLIFSSPAIVVFLTGLQNHQTIQLAGGMALQALIASAIDLFGKYKTGN